MTPPPASVAPHGAHPSPTTSMTGFDLAVFAIVALSALLAYLRGVVRELVALASWIAAVVLALAFGGPFAAMLPVLQDNPGARHVLAFALLFIGVLIIGAAAAVLLSRLIRAVGLGFLDRLLGAVFGVARGIAIVLLLILVAGVTALPRYDWWQNAALEPVLVSAALALRPWLPPGWAGRLDYSPGGREPAPRIVATAAAHAGESEPCAES